LIFFNVFSLEISKIINLSERGISLLLSSSSSSLCAAVSLDEIFVLDIVSLSLSLSLSVKKKKIISLSLSLPSNFQDYQSL